MTRSQLLTELVKCGKKLRDLRPLSDEQLAAALRQLTDTLEPEAAAPATTLPELSHLSDEGLAVLRRGDPKECQALAAGIGGATGAFSLEPVGEEWDGTVRPIEDLSYAPSAAIRAAVQAEREACARIVLAGGDGVDRLETAIRHGSNAALAEAILARGEP